MNKFIHSKLKFFIELTLTEVSKAKKVELFFCLFVVNLLVLFFYLFLNRSYIPFAKGRYCHRIKKCKFLYGHYQRLI